MSEKNNHESFISRHKKKLVAGLLGLGLSGAGYEAARSNENSSDTKAKVENVKRESTKIKQIGTENNLFKKVAFQEKKETSDNVNSDEEGGFGGIDEAELRKEKLEELEKTAAGYISKWKKEFPNLDFTFMNASETFKNDKDIKTALLFQVSKKVNGEEKSFYIELMIRKNGSIDYIVNPTDVNDDEVIATENLDDLNKLIKVKSDLLNI